MSETETLEGRAGALAEQLFGQLLAWFELTTVYLGTALGLYGTLKERGPVTAPGLADAAGVAERYAREWLEQQAVMGILDVDDPAADPDERRYTLPEAHQAVLCDPESPFSMIGPSWVPGSFGPVLRSLVDAYRTGADIPLPEYGEEFVIGQSLFNRPAFTHELADSWLPAVPGLVERLDGEPAARVADVACGAGWLSINLAKAFPKIAVDGIDLDEASITAARKNAAEAGVADRVSFEVRDAGDPQLAGQYDLVVIFEALHDMSRPVDTLRAVRQLVAEGGTVIVADEKVAEEFAAPGDEFERFIYSASVLHCLPVGLAEQPSAGTGAVLRPATVTTYATEAGFTDVEVLPVESDFFRFYRLVV